jgi:hypothetical protein
MAEPLPKPPAGSGKWNYRVMAREGVLGIHEVFYKDDGNVNWFSADPVPASGESMAELAADVQRQANALNQPVLDFHLLEQQAKYRRDGVYEDLVPPPQADSEE